MTLPDDGGCSSVAEVGAPPRAARGGGDAPGRREDAGRRRWRARTAAVPRVRGWSSSASGATRRRRSSGRREDLRQCRRDDAGRRRRRRRGLRWLARGGGGRDGRMRRGSGCALRRGRALGGRVNSSWAGAAVRVGSDRRNSTPRDELSLAQLQSSFSTSPSGLAERQFSYEAGTADADRPRPPNKKRRAQLG